MSNNRNIADIFSKSTAISTDTEVSTAVVTERTTVATLTGKTLLSPAMTNVIINPSNSSSTPLTINGVASQSTDYLNINTLTTGGTNIVKIDVNGNLGLGATPVAKLHVNGGIRQTGATVPFEWTVNPGAADYLKLNAVGYSDNLIVATSAGNVGIGTGSPSFTLDVKQSTGQINITSTTGTNLARYLLQNTGGSFQIGLDSSTGNSYGFGAYARVFWNDGAYPMVFTTASTERMRIDSTGNVGIGTSSPGVKLDVAGAIRSNGQIQLTLANNAATGSGQLYLNGATGNRIEFNGNGIAAPAFTTRSVGTKIVLFPNVGASAADYAIGIDSSTLWQSIPDSTGTFKWYAGQTNIGTLSGTGTFTVTGNITAYSDERLKSNIKTIENALNKVSKLRGVSFDKNGESGIGVIAQEVQEILPEVVQDGEYLSVAYGNIVGLLIEAIKEQQVQIENLKSRIA